MNDVTLNVALAKAGGRYPLSALCQKRAAALLKGAVPLVSGGGRADPFRTALREILQDKIVLVMPEAP